MPSAILTDQGVESRAVNRRIEAVPSMSVICLALGYDRSIYHLVRVCDRCAQSDGNSMAVKHVERVIK